MEFSLDLSIYVAAGKPHELRSRNYARSYFSFKPAQYCFALHLRLLIKSEMHYHRLKPCKAIYKAHHAISPSDLPPHHFYLIV